MLARLKETDNKVIGLRQTLKAIDQDKAEEIYLAKDCDSHIFHQVEQKAHEKGIPVNIVPHKKELGKACGIDVDAATVAILK